MILDKNIEKLKIQNLLSNEIVEEKPQLKDLSLNAEYNRYVWMLAVEELNPRIKESKFWDFRKRVVLYRGRAISLNSLGALTQLAFAAYRKDDEIQSL